MLLSSANSGICGMSVMNCNAGKSSQVFRKIQKYLTGNNILLISTYIYKSIRTVET